MKKFKPVDAKPEPTPLQPGQRKVLYSPGYGAGWVTWNSSKTGSAEFMLTYQPIIDFLEAGGTFSGGFSEKADQTRIEYNGDVADLSSLHPVLKKFAEEFHEKFGEYPYMGGAEQLRVEIVSGRVRVEEYDGNESLVHEGDDQGWM